MYFLYLNYNINYAYILKPRFQKYPTNKRSESQFIFAELILCHCVIHLTNSPESKTEGCVGGVMTKPENTITQRSNTLRVEYRSDEILYVIFP